MNYQTPSLRRALAADYAIGLMPPTACRRFEQLLLEDSELRAELAQWQDSLMSLTEPLTEQPVPDRVWREIKARIDPQTPQLPVTRPFRSWLRVTIAACSLVAAIALGVIYNHDEVRYGATLRSADAQSWMSIEAHENYLKIKTLALAKIEKNRSLEMWVIPSDGKPVSLGVVPPGGDGEIKLGSAQKALIGESITLAISLEPEGGSPTGRPTGPVLYQGVLTAL
ncbi:MULTISPECIES: anti-sigma factor domain-containing protein [unclassified Pseudomonas]|uniref:anti-sigma factor n=1 Tax=unclassified Pseudomonas TaxID=196821 RepID=UPI000A1E8D26|nr:MULTISPECIES: anti-sigma factor [unclassified Pseudomonas]